MAATCTSQMSEDLRLRTLWIGPIPIKQDVVEFENRNLALEFVDILGAEKELPFAKGLVFKFNPKKPGSIVKSLLTLAEKAINNGVLIYVIVDNDSALNLILKKIPVVFRNRLFLRTNPPMHEVAEKIARHATGPSLNAKVEILPTTETNWLDETEELFMKRAFSDSKTLTIKPLMGGRSASKIYCVNAVFENSKVGPRPLPFFAKIDSREKIELERSNYRLYVTGFVPFNLRPNLDEKRCIVGSDRGIIVGNFVEQAESLWSIARRGVAQSAIYLIFDSALRGWRLQAESQKANLAKSMNESSNIVDVSRIPLSRTHLAKKLGCKHTPSELLKMLYSLPETNYLVAPMHGDLHPFNIMVRGSDPILIDFVSTRIGPLVADPASLEVSFAFEIPEGDEDNDGWAKLMSGLYNAQYLETPPPPAREPAAREWLWTCIRQIRLMALAEKTSKYEYSIAVALYLLRRAMYPAESRHDDLRKAYACLFAEKIISSIPPRV